ncbi:PIG-L deacetylase family protein [Catenovulum sediminis]|uniref:PIG-L deacetylase family protein n=1 Tax=Catenovulum sediminis TaxID=1740262 RepID=A0ABV1RMV8_9ALTE
MRNLIIFAASLLCVVTYCRANDSIADSIDTVQLVKPQHTAVIILAHPDDENWISGSLALWSEQGSKLQVIYASSGGAGKDRSGQNLRGIQLATQREKESINGLKVLGVSLPPIFLRFDDRKLETFQQKMTNRILAVCHQLKPQHLISFDSKGITGHKDHQFVHQLTNQLWRDKPSCGVAAGVILSNFVVSKSRASIAAQISANTQYKKIIRYYLSDDQISLSVDTSQQAAKRIAAFNVYKTQFSPELQSLWARFVQYSAAEDFIIIDY